MKQGRTIVTILLLACLLLTAAGCQASDAADDANQAAVDGNTGQGPNGAPPEGIDGTPPEGMEGMPPEGGRGGGQRPDGMMGPTSWITGAYSTKEFAAQEVSAEIIEQILTSGAQAPSARNLQPWHFTVVTGYEMVGQIASHAAEGCVAIIVSGTTEEQEGVDVPFDCALATQNMYLAAQALGLGAHLYGAPVSNINSQYREQLGIPEGYDAQIVLCVGYVPDDVDAVSSASTRNDLSGMVNYVE